jgi:hypothetical protein
LNPYLKNIKIKAIKLKAECPLGKDFVFILFGLSLLTNLLIASVVIARGINVFIYKILKSRARLAIQRFYYYLRIRNAYVRINCMLKIYCSKYSKLN